MTKRKNPFSTRWDRRINLSKLLSTDAKLYQTFEFIQTVLYCEDILIEMDPALYLPALEEWGKKYPDYFQTIQDLAVQADNDFNYKSVRIPKFVSALFLDVFREMDEMVNGKATNLSFYLKLFWA